MGEQDGALHINRDEPRSPSSSFAKAEDPRMTPTNIFEEQMYLLPLLPVFRMVQGVLEVKQNPSCSQIHLRGGRHER